VTHARAALVYNPRAGRVLRNRSKFDEALLILREAWPEIRLVETTGPRTAGPLARNAVDEGANLVIVCGGDGTINEVVQSMSGTEVPVGILPGGTACVLANEIGLGNDMVRAARLLTGSEPYDVATGVLRQGESATAFLLMAGIGFDALLVHGLNTATKEKWGKLAYWWAAVREIGRRLDRFEVVVDGVAMPSTFTLVSRVRNYGGDVEIARGASLLSDDLELVIFETTSVVRLAWLLATSVLTRTLHRRRDVRVVKARRVEASAKGVPVHVQVDGEAAGVLPATIEVAPAAIRLMLPPAFLAAERARR
jgi:YegS/Rv2252/BmrU family lipid kinase